jgi:GT2 family glycosyltransferase
MSVYGVPHQPCALLDGLMLVPRSTVLNERGVFFDPQFPFHFYDMDFCRQAELKGLKMDTATIKVIHSSGGTFGSPQWAAAYQCYLRKYGS